MLTLQDICVNYSYKRVLAGISLNFEKGKIYSLLGENGAGKSTLAHVLCGDIKQSSGEIFLNNKQIFFKSPKDAIKHGIICVHQRPLLSPSISIQDNLKIGIKKTQEAKIPELAEKWLSGKELSEIVKKLNEEEKFNTSLVGALLKSPAVIILDEPPFLDQTKIRELAAAGLTIIIITHSYKEAIEKSDEIILLKDGTVLEKKAASEITEKEIKEKLFGLTKTIELPENIKCENITEKEVLNLRLTTNHKSKTSHFTGYIPSDRSFRASNPNVSILQLLTIYRTNQKEKELEKYANQLLQKADVNIKLNEKVSCLSGGMLQRLILEREISENPEKLYLFNPTHGLDAEATERLYEKLKKLAEKGTKVIIGSSE